MVDVCAVDGSADDGTVVIDDGHSPDWSRARERRREPALRPGDRIARYVLVRRLGAGGMGVVWVARDPRLDRTVAIKVLHEQRSSATLAAERLRREAMALARLSHPNVVSIYDVGIHEHRVFLTMEHIEGQTLDRWAEDEPSLQQVLEVFEQAAAGLSAVHGAGFIHRDFKPSNVMIDRRGRVHVMDFGLARVRDPDTQSELDATLSSSALHLDASRLFSTVLTGDGVVMGTPAYMAPEQHVGEEADARADQFSFFASLYEVLMGRRAFAGQSLEDLARGKQAGALDFADGRLALPRTARSMLRRGLDPEPSRRHPDMEAVRRLLARLRGQRRRRWPAVAAASTALLGAVGLSSQPGTASEACETAGESMAEIWGPGPRVELRRAFEQTEVSYADDAATRAIERLDDYAEAWGAAHQRACEQAGESAAALDLRMSCLGKARTSLGATVELLLDADATVVQHAVGQVSGLPSLARCDDMLALEAEVAPPRDPEVAAVIEQIESTIESAHALERAGHYPRGRQVASEALARARQVGHEPSIARAQIRLGSLLLSLGDGAASRQQLVEAALLAAGAGDHHAAADAASRLVYVCAEELSDPTGGARWARHAEASLERMPPDPLARARLDGNLAIMRSSEGRFAEAMELFARSYEVKRTILGDEHPEVLGGLENLALSYGELGRPVEAEALQRRAVKMLGRVLGTRHPDYALSLTNLGRSVDILGRHDEAAEHYTQALGVFQRALGPDHPMVARTLSALGHVAMVQDRPHEAGAYYREASEIIERTLGDRHREFAWSLVDRAIISSQLGRDEEALSLYARARGILEAVGGSEHTSLAYLLMSEATSLIELSRFDRAERSLAHAKEIIEASLEPGHPIRGSWHANRGELLRARQQLPAARTELRLALEIASASLGPEHPETASILLSLGSVERELGELDSAQAHLRRALSITEASPVGEAFRSAARFALARALWATPATRDEARQLAGQAREGFAIDEEVYAEDLAEIDAWRASHR